MLSIILGLLGLFSWQEYNPAVFSPSQDSIRHPGHHKNNVRDSTGRFVHINRVFIIGNRLTRDQIILRELTLKSGDIIFSTELAEILELDKKKLINTRLFNTVEIRMLELSPDQVDLLVDLNERWYTFPAPIFELADRNFNEWWQNYNHDFRRVNYGLRLYQYNMRGRNETLLLHAQHGFLRRLELTYRFPYIDRQQKQGLILDVDFSETRNLAFRTFDHKLEYITKADNILRTTRGASVTYTYRNSFYETHGLKLEYRNTSVSDTVVLLNPNYLGDGKKEQQWAAMTYIFTSDHRDYIGYPLKGYYLQAYIARTGFPSLEDVSKVDVSVLYSRFFDLKQGFFISNNTVGYWSTPNHLPYVNYSAMGYRKQFIRGYEVYVIEGPQYFLNKTTLKKKIFSRTYHWGAMPIPQFRHIPFSIYLKTYADIGYVTNYSNYNLNERLSNKFLSGAGFGVDIVGSYDAVLRLEYSFNAEGGRGFFFHMRREF
jgi:outer membrane protein assembly factor BamA